MTHYAYNIHNILTISSNEPLHNPAFHRYFEVDEVSDPDIIVRFDTTPVVETSSRYRHDLWFYGAPGDDLVYYQDRLLGQRDEVVLRDLDGERTEIVANTLDRPNVTPRSRGSVADLIESVIDYKLLQEGYTTIHAGALCRDEEAVLLAGFPNVGKTLSTLHLLEQGYAYMGDDNGVIGRDGSVLAYPSTSSIGYHDFLKFIEPERIGRGRYYEYLARVYPMQNPIIERLFDYPEVYLPDLGFEQGDVADVSVAACLEIGNRSIREESRGALTNKIVASTDYSRPRIWQNPFLHVWAYFMDKELGYWKDEEWKIIHRFLERADRYTLACEYRDWDGVLDEVLVR